MKQVLRVRLVLLCLFFLCLGIVSCSQSGESLFEKAEQYERNGNTEKAFQYYKQSAEKGYAEAQCVLGNWYTAGRGVKQDFAEAVKWYRKSAEQGFGPAYQNLAIMYSRGVGVKKDFDEAMKWLRKGDQENKETRLEMLNTLFWH